MRTIRFDPASLPPHEKAWWDAWQQRADAATRKLIDDVEHGRDPSFNAALWSELKTWLLENVFNGKCAYCETQVTAGFFGDAEHYRPKKKVTVRTGTRDSEVVWQGQPHPGYYWLAYDWRNLLPACQRCNSATGKMNQFPVRKQHVGSHVPPPADPSTLDEQEVPLLLHPYVHLPEQHLAFGAKGVVAGTSPEGEQSVRTYALDRDDLVRARQGAQEEAWRAFRGAQAMSFMSGVPIRQALAGVLEPLRQGTEPYSLAALHYIKLMKEEEDRAARDLLGADEIHFDTG